MRKQALFEAFKIPLLIAILAIPVLFSSGAFAQTSNITAPADACSNMQSNGFTTGLVICIQYDIMQAAHLFENQLQTVLQPYEAACIILAITLFGMRLLTAQTEHMVKEVFLLLFKIGGAMLLISFANSGNLYLLLTAIIGDMVGWLTTPFATLLNSQCIPPALTLPKTGDYGASWNLSTTQYAPWQELDCIFGQIIETQANSSSITDTSMTVIISMAILSLTSNLGLMVAFFGVIAIIILLYTVARALYVFLLSYLILAFLVIFTPLVAPLIIFRSHQADGYARQLFDRWLGLIISTLFNPLFVIGYLTFAAAVMNVFINGNDNDLPKCTVSTQATQNYSICSYWQLFIGPNAIKPFNQNFEAGHTLFSFSFVGDTVKQGIDAGAEAAIEAVDTTAILATGVAQNQSQATIDQNLKNMQKNVVSQVSQFVQNATNIALSATVLTSAIDHALVQLFLTLITFIIVMLVMVKLLDVIPEMAQSITITVGISIMQQTRDIPFYRTLIAGVDSSYQAMKSSPLGLGRLGAGMKGALSGMSSEMIGKR